jgi:hypothetical protein
MAAMRPEDLLKFWDSGENARLTVKQYSIRLPIHVAARIAALCEMYPKKTRTDIIGDLLACALDQFEAGLPYVESRRGGAEGEPDPRTQFRLLTEKYLQEQEAELRRNDTAEMSGIS